MESAFRLYAWNLAYADALVRDLSHAQCTESGGPGLENHPAWTIGHLVTASDMLAEDLGLERDTPDAWRELFERRGPGDPRLPDANRDAYPPVQTLLAELARQHERVESAWRGKLSERGDDDSRAQGAAAQGAEAQDSGAQGAGAQGAGAQGAEADRSPLDAPLEWRFDASLPTLGDAVLFFAASHEAMHLAQLAAWRRARGLPSALASL